MQTTYTSFTGVCIPECWKFSAPEKKTSSFWRTLRVRNEKNWSSAFLFLCVFITTVFFDESLPPSSLVGEKPKELRCCSSKLKPNHRWKSSRKSLVCEKLWRTFFVDNRRGLAPGVPLNPLWSKKSLHVLYFRHGMVFYGSIHSHGGLIQLGLLSTADGPRRTTAGGPKVIFK